MEQLSLDIWEVFDCILVLQDLFHCQKFLLFQETLPLLFCVHENVFVFSDRKSGFLSLCFHLLDKATIKNTVQELEIFRRTRAGITALLSSWEW